MIYTSHPQRFLMASLCQSLVVSTLHTRWTFRCLRAGGRHLAGIRNRHQQHHMKSVQCCLQIGHGQDEVVLLVFAFAAEMEPLVGPRSCRLADYHHASGIFSCVCADRALHEQGRGAAAVPCAGGQHRAGHRRGLWRGARAGEGGAAELQDHQGAAAAIRLVCALP